MRKIVTTEDITKGEEHVHAYGYAKAVEHLREFRVEWDRLEWHRLNPEPAVSEAAP